MHVHDVRKCFFGLWYFAFWSPQMIEHNITQTIDLMEKIVPINLVHDSFWIQCIHFLQDSNLRVSIKVVIEFKNAFRIFTMVNDEIKSGPWINTIIEFSAQLSYSWDPTNNSKTTSCQFSQKYFTWLFFLICWSDFNSKNKFLAKKI